MIKLLLRMIQLVEKWYYIIFNKVKLICASLWDKMLDRLSKWCGKNYFYVLIAPALPKVFHFLGFVYFNVFLLAAQ
jgi:hypothetical protein